MHVAAMHENQPFAYKGVFTMSKGCTNLFEVVTSPGITYLSCYQCSSSNAFGSKRDYTYLYMHIYRYAIIDSMYGNKEMCNWSATITCCVTQL